jgi:predicted nuclease of predicted toxin-antitoxin system
MKLLLDQGLPRSAVKHLTAAGVVAEHAGDLGLASANDEEILAAARQRQAVLVTLDADFHRLLADSRATSPSVVRIRIEGLKGDQLAAVLVQVIAATSAELATGAAVSATQHRIRTRFLPLAP